MTFTFDLARAKPKGSLYDKGVYPPEFNDEFKAYIRKRDDYECALCPTGGDTLDVHHINYTKYTVKVNCISLCRECHEIVHSDRSLWFRHMFSSHLYAIVLQRENIKNSEQLRIAWSQSNAH